MIYHNGIEGQNKRDWYSRTLNSIPTRYADYLIVGDFGDYTVVHYTKKAEGITNLINDLAKSSGQKKTFDQIRAWDDSAQLRVVPEAVAVPQVLPVDDAVDKTIVALGGFVTEEHKQ